jgi:hypothetical protein
LRVLPGGTPAPTEAFELGFVDADGVEQRVPLAEAAGVRFEACRPVRSFPSFKGQRTFPGLWWSATMGRHVGFESWLERDHAMLLGFDPRVVAFAPQPFWPFWPKTAGNRAKVRSHAPDWFARLDDDTAVVVDCRPIERRPLATWRRLRPQSGRAPRWAGGIGQGLGKCGLVSLVMVG